MYTALLPEVILFRVTLDTNSLSDSYDFINTLKTKCHSIGVCNCFIVFVSKFCSCRILSWHYWKKVELILSASFGSGRGEVPPLTLFGYCISIIHCRHVGVLSGVEFGGPLRHVRDPALKHGTLRTQPPPPGTKIAPRARVWPPSKHVTTTALGT